jgi:replicative DNA helicase
MTITASEARAMGLRIPPSSVEAEQAVIGGLMLVPDKIEAVSTNLAVDDFYRKDHQMIYRAMLELSGRGQPCDAVTLGDWFDANGFAEMMGGGSYLIDLASTTPSAANIEAYAEIVREKSVRRQVIDKGTAMVEQAYGSDSDAVSLVDGSITELMALQKIEARAEFSITQVLTAAYAEAQRARELGTTIPGIPTGLGRLDYVLGGWHDSDLVVVGARPAMGKTALLLNFLVSCKVKCGLISAEQPMQQIGARLLSLKSHVDAEKMRSGRFRDEDYGRLQNAIAELTDRTIQVYDRSSPTIADVTRMARKWKHECGIRILFVDYIQRIKAVQTSKNANKSERVGEVVQGLKNLARDLEIPVIALAQVSRSVDSREDKQPGMGDLSDSSEIEKEADQVITLYRPYVHDENAEPALAILSIEKNRHGATGVVKAAWIAESMRFEEYGYDDRA